MLTEPHAYESAEDTDHSHNSYDGLADSQSWGVVSDEGEIEDVSEERLLNEEENNNYGSGTLILSGSEEGSDNAVAFYGGEMELSIPRTDSLPTDLESMEARTIGDNNAKPPPSNEPRQASGDCDKKVESKQAGSTEAGMKDDRPADVYSEDANPQDDGIKRALYTLISVLIFLTGYLVWERNSWRSSAIRLEEEMRKLQEKYHTATIAQCDPEKMTTLKMLDNCWVKARANVELGDCASEATKALVEYSNSVIEKVDQFGNELWDYVQLTESGENSKNFSANVMDRADHPGKAATEAASIFDEDPIVAAGAKMQEAASAIATTSTAAGEAIISGVSIAIDSLEESVSWLSEIAKRAGVEAAYDSYIQQEIP